MRRALIVTLLCFAPLASAAEGFDARFAAAVARAEAGDHAAAIAGFEALAADFPARPEPLNNLAAELARRGDLERARETLERALRTDPVYATAHDNLRTVYAALASDAYRKALPVGGDPVAAPELALIAQAAPEPERVAVTPPPASATVAVASAPMTTATPARPSSSLQPSAARPAAADPLAAFNGLAYGAFGAADAWARAWARKDVAAYLASYGAAFVPPDGLSRAAWEAQRAERIRAPKQISVALAQRELTLERDGTRGSLRFVQSYRSDRFTGSAWKTLELVHEQGRWLIVAERAGR